MKSKDQRLHGVIPAVATPFDVEGNLDEAEFVSLLEWYIDCGVHGVSVAGSQGEFFVLESHERRRIVELAVETVSRRVPVYAGTGAVSTRESISLTRHAESVGVDVVMLITPYFIHPSADELVDHFEGVAASTSLPVLLYNNPPRTSVNVTPEVFHRCFEVDNVIGIKDSSGDMTQVIEYLRLTERQSLVYSGRDTLIVDIVLQGGVGAISPAANVFPRLVIRLYEAVRSGDLDTARYLGDVLAPLRMAWSWASFPVVIKEAMAMSGRGNGQARGPIRRLNCNRRQELVDILENIKKVESEMA